ncbi:glycerol kinase GlpK [Rhodoflexus caldus]|uniref:glycerol kinase GlpK n=1 Tax=Rhodoflexus caldus TaxID=2891236 RepID=UPI00202A0F3D|nr:glycerol kinase GlpK [Rhodoflexus caldus]
MKYILSIDQGTTSCRSIIFDENGRMVGIGQKEFRQIYPRPGWVEHDPIEIWNTQLQTMKDAVQQSMLQFSDISAIGITNQRETTVVWNKATGEPVYNAIVWQDRRTAELCDRLKNEGMEPYIRENTGLVADAYFSATKLAWILDTYPELRQKAEAGEILFGTIDTWLIWNLTKGWVHATDYSNASRTMLYNIRNLDWDQTLLDHLNIPRAMLPEVRPSAGSFDTTDKSLFDGAEIPITGVAGDQQAALFGHACFQPGMAKNTYGTGCFLLKNTGKQPVKSKHGLITTIAWGIDNQVEYALEGSIFIAGAAIQWLRDGLKLIDEAADSEHFAAKVPHSDGVYVVPAFAGLGTPYWDMYARGAIFGLTRGTTKSHIVRATLESLAYQTRDVLDAMTKDDKVSLKALRVDGGASANNLLMQFQADVLGVEVQRPDVIESAARGAAFLAGIGIGLWTKEQIAALWKVERNFRPQLNSYEADKRYMGWQEAVKRTMNWTKAVE